MKTKGCDLDKQRFTWNRLEGKDANNILQSYTDVLPGRPTSQEHRDPGDDLRDHYHRETAQAISKLHAFTIMAGEFMTHDYYMTIGPQFSDPIARQLYAEIASIEEQHVTLCCVRIKPPCQNYMGEIPRL